VKATYDAEANAAYVYFFSEDLMSYGTEEVAPGVILDMIPSGGAGGTGWVPMGIELLNPKPRPRLAAIAAEHGFAHLLDDIYAALDAALGISIGGAATLTRTEVSFPPSGTA
jgi:uncharacterized protein DUF2283